MLNFQEKKNSSCSLMTAARSINCCYARREACESSAGFPHSAAWCDSFAFCTEGSSVRASWGGGEATEKHLKDSSSVPPCSVLLGPHSSTFCALPLQKVEERPPLFLWWSTVLSPPHGGMTYTYYWLNIISLILCSFQNSNVMGGATEVVMQSN